MRQYTTDNRAFTGPLLVSGVIGAVAVSLAVISSVRQDGSALVAPSVWPWLLTGLQVLSLWSVGQRRWWGWLLGGSVQLPWIAYAVVTNQVGFIPGCAISAFVQIYSFLRNSTARKPMEALA